MGGLTVVQKRSTPMRECITKVRQTIPVIGRALVSAFPNAFLSTRRIPGLKTFFAIICFGLGVRGPAFEKGALADKH